MNGAELQIEIFKPFGEAFELMKRILFRPFDLKKWCVIGFAAFLAHLGGAFNFNYNYNSRGMARDSPFWKNLAESVGQFPPWILIFSMIVVVLIVIAVTVLFAWLRARGRFIFIDCIVKNRGAIAQPWREFRIEGNSYFLFTLLVGCVIFFILALVSLPFMLSIIRGVTFLHLHDVYFVSMIILWSLVFLFLLLAWALIAHFMVPVMYCRRCRAGEALRVSVSLIANYPGEITLYCLFWIVLVIGAALIGCASICATCCVTIIPYVGTVILLPVFVCLRAFGLLFLRQFGTDYDVWGGVEPLPEISSPPLLPTTPPIQA